VTRVTSKNALPKGAVKLRGEFKYDGGGLGKGGTMLLFVNDQKVGEARVAQTQGITLGLGGALDVGEDTGSAVDDAYTPPFRFNGQIQQVKVDLQAK
jgi:arylsulfatase